jgi:hypothetical protein
MARSANLGFARFARHASAGRRKIMTKVVLSFPVGECGSLSCVWIRNTNPRQPLACIWIDHAGSRTLHDEEN